MTGLWAFPAGAVVYSEGQLRTPFKARFQGDPQAESYTRVDGIAGDFSIAEGTKLGIELAPSRWHLYQLRYRFVALDALPGRSTPQRNECRCSSRRAE